MTKKPLKLTKLTKSHYAIASSNFSKLLHFKCFLQGIFRINVKLNFYLIQILRFLIFVSRKI